MGSFDNLDNLIILNLAKWFWRYLNFSNQKYKIFLDKRIYISESGTKKKIFKGFLCNFLRINTHSFVKNDSKFENKGLFLYKILWSLT